MEGQISFESVNIRNTSFQAIQMQPHLIEMGYTDTLHNHNQVNF